VLGWPAGIEQEVSGMNRQFKVTMAAAIVLELGSLVLVVVARDWGLIWIPVLLLGLAGVLILMVRREAQGRQKS
jgi:hypothetical protein